MSNRKFISPADITDTSVLNTDYDNAAVFEGLRVGRHGVYFRNGFRLKFIPYDYMERVFIRIHEVNGKLCCGNTVFQYFRLVFVHDGKEFADVISENSRSMDDALALIAENAPDVAIGVVK